MREKLDDIVHELSETKTIADPARAELLKTRKAVIAAWNSVAAKLESQGEIVLGADVRSMHLAPALTDRERLAVQLVERAKAKRLEGTRKNDPIRDRTLELTR